MTDEVQCHLCVQMCIALAAVYILHWCSRFMVTVQPQGQPEVLAKGLPVLEGLTQAAKQ